MPNWASTTYKAVGDAKQLTELHSIMKELQELPSPGLHNNGFGETWFGNLVIKLGGDWKKIYCRGWWDNLQYQDGELSFFCESAWDELNEVRHFIEEKFPDIKLYYQTEESGMGIYSTNDESGEFFSDRYILWIEDQDSEYYDSLEEVLEVIEDLTGSKHLHTLDAGRKALESYATRHDCGYILEEFKVISD